MKWKEAAAQLGTSTLVGSLKALEPTMKKRQYKRLISTTVAQLLELHPDVGPKKARRWVRQATGTRVAKGGMSRMGAKELVEAAGVATVAAGAAKVAGRVAERVGGARNGSQSDDEDQQQQA